MDCLVSIFGAKTVFIVGDNTIYQIYRYLNEKKLKSIVIGFFLLSFLVCLGNFLVQMWEIGFTTADDTESSAKLPVELWGLIVQNWSNESFRSSYIPSLFLNYLRTLLSYKQSSFRLITILPILFEIGVFSYFIYLNFKNKMVAIGSAFFVLALFQHSWFHHSLSAFIFNFNFAFCLMLLSFIFYIRALKTPKFSIFFFSGLLFGISFLVYELFFPYILVFPFLLLLHKDKKVGFWDKKIILQNATFLLPVFVFFLLVAKYYLKESGQSYYPGTSVVSNFSILSYFKAIKIFSFSALPGTIFQFYHINIEQYFRATGVGFEFTQLFDKMRLAWVSIPLTFSLLMVYLNIQGKKIKIPTKSFFILFIVSVLFVFLPNVLLSLTEAHQRRALTSEFIYSGTHFSVFGWVFLACWLSYYASKVFGRASTIIVFLVGVFCFVQVYRNQISNTVIANVQSLHYSSWKMLEEFYKDGYFKTHKDKEPVYIADGMMGEQNKYWGIFHPKENWEWWRYWYKFSKNAFGEHLPIFVNIPNCDRAISDCNKRKNRYSIQFRIDYTNKYSSLKICPLKLNGADKANSGEKCAVKNHHLYF